MLILSNICPRVLYWYWLEPLTSAIIVNFITDDDHNITNIAQDRASSRQDPKQIGLHVSKREKTISLWNQGVILLLLLGETYEKIKITSWQSWQTEPSIGYTECCCNSELVLEGQRKQCDVLGSMFDAQNWHVYGDACWLGGAPFRIVVCIVRWDTGKGFSAAL